MQKYTTDLKEEETDLLQENNSIRKQNTKGKSKTIHSKNF